MERSEQLTAAPGTGLERSCGPGGGDRIRLAAASRGIERIEARFHGNGFSPHRHDTYAIGITVSGVQTFKYRGASRFSLPGKVIVLHPDEVHDGAAGTEDGLVYRMIYLAPELVSDAGGDPAQPLPFVSGPVVDDAALRQALADILADLAREPDDLLLDDALSRIAAGLRRNADATPSSPARTISTHASAIRCLPPNSNWSAAWTATSWRGTSAECWAQARTATW